MRDVCALCVMCMGVVAGLCRSQLRLRLLCGSRSIWLERVKSSRGFIVKVAGAGRSWPQDILPSSPVPGPWCSPESLRSVSSQSWLRSSCMPAMPLANKPYYVEHLMTHQAACMQLPSRLCTS